MYYPIGIQSFEKLRQGGFVYVDKTDLVYKLTRGSVYFLGRPRRFGKSLLVSTLKAYFEEIHDRGYAKAFEADTRQLHVIGASFSSKTGTIEQWICK